MSLSPETTTPQIDRHLWLAYPEHLAMLDVIGYTYLHGNQSETALYNGRKQGERTGVLTI